MSAFLRKQLAEKAEPKEIKSQPFVHRPLLVGNKGMVHRVAEILDDCVKLIPHAKKDNRLPMSDIVELDEIAKDSFCDTVCLFQTMHKIEPYLWLADAKNGPSICFFFEEGRSMYDLAYVGNALKGSRPLCIFDKAFEKDDVFKLSKILLSRMFEVPNGDRHSKPFVDRAMSFFVEDDTIVIRHYQVQWEDPPVLVEIGPRITLLPVFILAGVMKGPKIWKHPTWQSPYSRKKEEKHEKAEMKAHLRIKKAHQEERRSKLKKPEDKHKGFFAAPNADDDENENEEQEA